MERSKALKILEITSQATNLEIKKAYRCLSLLWHPDKYEQNPTKHPANSKKEAEAKMKEINQAYGILTEKERKDNFKISDDDIWLAKTKVEIALENFYLDYEDVFEEGKAEDDYLEIFKKCQTKEELAEQTERFLWRIYVYVRTYNTDYFKDKKTKKARREAEKENLEEERKRKLLEEQAKKIKEAEKELEELIRIHREQENKGKIIVMLVVMIFFLLGWWVWRKIRSVF